MARVKAAILGALLVLTALRGGAGLARADEPAIDPARSPREEAAVIPYAAVVRYARLLSGPGETVVHVVDAASPCGHGPRHLIEDCVRRIFREGFILPFGELGTELVAPGAIQAPVIVAPISR